MNQYVRAAQARERAAAYAFRPRHPIGRALRPYAILTAVIVLWVLSFVAAYDWYGPALVGR